MPEARGSKCAAKGSNCRGDKMKKICNSDYIEMETSKGFYIGDICYVLDEKTYGEWCRMGPDNTGLFEKDGESFAVGNVHDGDGTYRDTQGNLYDVDAGVIGVIPFEMLDGHHRSDMHWENGRMVKAHGPTRILFACDGDGKFDIGWYRQDDESDMTMTKILTKKAGE